VERGAVDRMIHPGARRRRWHWWPPRRVVDAGSASCACSCMLTPVAERSLATARSAIKACAPSKPLRNSRPRLTDQHGLPKVNTLSSDLFLKTARRHCQPTIFGQGLAGITCVPTIRGPSVAPSNPWLPTSIADAATQRRAAPGLQRELRRWHRGINHV